MIEFWSHSCCCWAQGFVLIGALGVVRMPDLMLRMHTTTKAGALGGGAIAIAGGLSISPKPMSWSGHWPSWRSSF
jgi:monovalent cation/proton antiporter MnhG/PhaG subunit